MMRKEQNVVELQQNGGGSKRRIIVSLEKIRFYKGNKRNE
jgi:hypothetical protein